MRRGESPSSPQKAVEKAASQGDDGVGTANGPEHAGLLEAGADYGLAVGFDDAKADKQVWVTKLGVAHAFGISLQVGGFDAKLLDDFGIG
jgi:hypothetical protein